MSVIFAAVLTVQTFSGLPLARAEALALGRSPDVTVATQKVTERQALLDAARASYGPALTTNYSLAPQGGNTGNTVAQRLTTFGGQVTLGDLIAYSPVVAEANSTLRAAQFDLASVQRSERINVINLYFTALSDRATLGARRVALSGAQSELRAARLRFHSGDAPRLDVVRAHVAVAQAQADVARAEAEAQNADAAFGEEIGIAPAQLTTADGGPPASQPFDADPRTAVTAALSHRPEVASAQANVAAEERAVAVAQRGGFPLVTVNGGYTTGVDSEVKVSGPSLTVNASLPVGGAAHDRVVAERARLAQARAQLVKVRRQIVTEVGAAVRTYRAQSVALAAATRALAEARAEYAATQTGYRNGASSSLDVETARATYVQALVAQVSALYAQAQARATLDLLVGSTNA
jgi:outer membrane protein TolC